MDPLTALGVASNIIQLVDFSTRVIHCAREIYNSADGRLEDHVTLGKSSQNLAELATELQSLPLQRLQRPTAADAQLRELATSSETLVRKLLDTLDQTRLKGGNRKVQAISHALRAKNQKEISALENRLDDVRKQLDTTLLISLRHSISNLTAQNKPTPQAFDDVFVRESKQRHAELLNAIQAKDWQPSSSNDVKDFGYQLQSNTEGDVENRFCRMILARLYFQNMPDRAENIPEAHKDTFNWLFKPAAESSGPQSWDPFSEWLKREGDPIYWVTGKPGAGKSTLMKFLCERKELTESLRKWSQGRCVTQASFYFWNSGAVMQMSRLGLLQALLYHCLCNEKEDILILFKDRWEQFLAFGGGREAFDWPELRRAFKSMIANTKKRFFFLIDGLDEFDGEPRDIINFVLDSAQPNVKICAASRPWLPFENAFGNRPNLLLERLTRSDIAAYVSTQFTQHHGYTSLNRTYPEETRALIQNIIDRASGVFLWVTLVCQSLLDGMSNRDQIFDLQQRLDALPSDLETLFDRLLDKLSPHYYQHACRLFQLERYFRETAFHLLHTQSRAPMLLEMYFADDNDGESSLIAPWSPLSEDDKKQRASDMRWRIVASCRGFLEVQTPHKYNAREGAVAHLIPSRRPMTEDPDSPVRFLHRTARDFIESDAYWQKVVSASGQGYSPSKQWGNGLLLHLKARAGLWEVHQVQCVRWAIKQQDVSGRFRRSYLDALFQIIEPNASSTIDFVKSILNETELLVGVSDYLIMGLQNADERRRSDLLTFLQLILSNLTTPYNSRRFYLEPLFRARRYYNSPSYLRYLLPKPKPPLYSVARGKKPTAWPEISERSCFETCL